MTYIAPSGAVVEDGPHKFVQWKEQPGYLWCMAYVPDGPGWLRLCRGVKTAPQHLEVKADAGAEDDGGAAERAAAFAREA